MKLIQSIDLPDHFYSRTNSLKKIQSQQLDFDVFIERLQVFNRRSILGMTSISLWYGWINEDRKNIEDWERQSDILVSMYGAQLCALGEMYCSEEGVNLTEVDFRILISDMQSIYDCIFTGKLAQNNKHIIRKKFRKLRRHQVLGSLISKDPGYVLVDLEMSRLSFQQWKRRSYYKFDFVRVWLIYSEFRDLLKEHLYRHKKVCLTLEAAEKYLQQLEDGFLRTSYTQFIRVSFGIYSIVSYNSKEMSAHSGRLNLSSPIVGKKLEDEYGITPEEIKIVATRLIADKDFLNDQKKQLELFPTMLRKYSAPLHFLDIRPMLALEGEFLSNLVVPSPASMLLCIRRFLLDELIGSLQKHIINKESLESDDTTVLNLRGIGYENYLKKSLGKYPNTIVVDTLDVKGTSKPDFIWNGKKSVIFIEAKIRLKSNQDIECTRPLSLLNAWETIGDAIKQTQGFLIKHSDSLLQKFHIKERHIGLIVVTEEPIPEVSTYFKVAAKRWGLLQNTTLSYIALMSTGELEYVMKMYSPDEVAARLQATWDKLDPNNLSSELVDFSLFDGIKKLDGNEFIREKAILLLPQLEL